MLKNGKERGTPSALPGTSPISKDRNGEEEQTPTLGKLENMF
jgi:hypothetical protein